MFSSLYIFPVWGDSCRENSYFTLNDDGEAKQNDGNLQYA
jgi:hypothetical protein